jgi:hypothetical protein
VKRKTLKGGYFLEIHQKMERRNSFQDVRQALKPAVREQQVHPDEQPLQELTPEQKAKLKTMLNMCPQVKQKLRRIPSFGLQGVNARDWVRVSDVATRMCTAAEATEINQKRGLPPKVSQYELDPDYLAEVIHVLGQHEAAQAAAGGTRRRRRRRHSRKSKQSKRKRSTRRRR